MCDTFVVMGNKTKNGDIIFGKNSDREPNEVQALEYYSEKNYDLSTNPIVKLTYMSIPQVAHTNAIMISRPSWMWGAEFGFNEFGLNIGNEAVFTKEKIIKDNCLTGMDILRLALERCKTSKEALEYIINLISKYNQGGDCGYSKHFYYHNSYLISDKSEAYVLETAGKYWCYKKVKDFYSISNCLSLHDYDGCHKDLIKNAIKKGYCKSENDFDFVKCYSNKLMTSFAKSEFRRDVSMSLLDRKDFTVFDGIDLLRTHMGGAIKGFAEVGSLCMHAGSLIGDHTTASYCASISDNSKYFITNSSMPCMSFYKPIVFGQNDYLSNENDLNKGKNLFLDRELLFRSFIGGNESKDKYLSSLNILETDYISRFIESNDNLLEISKDCFDKENDLISFYLKERKEKNLEFKVGSLFYRNYWKSESKKLFK